MQSIEEVRIAVAELRHAAGSLADRCGTSATLLQRHGHRLAGVGRGSRTAEQAATQVKEAERALQDCIAKLRELQTATDEYLELSGR